MRTFTVFCFVILSYRDKRTTDFAFGKRVKAFDGIKRAASMKLDRLDAAAGVSDLAALPGNRLEALKGDRKGQHASALMISGGFVSNGTRVRLARRMSRSSTTIRRTNDTDCNSPR
jgi:plasmid maintenance system killer protein